MEDIKYAIYPSLLDAYLRFKRHDDDETFNALFDKINGVKTEQTDQQLKGVEFEKLINDLIDGKCVNLVDGHYITDYFSFTVDLVDKIAIRLQQASVKQQYLEAIIPSHLGNIKLYGIADYTFPEMITDLKTTGNYKCNKYKDYTQHPAYSLISEINGNPIMAFKYLITDFNKLYQETYIPTLGMHQKLMATIFEFINFIEYFKSNITDEKIFGKERQTGPERFAQAHH
jgi:hypothetical protein